MAEPQILEGRSLLVVEDEYLIAVDLVATLESAGATVVGPAGSINEALLLIKEQGEQLNGAVLDINLRNERVYPVADQLAAQKIPFVFTTGYDAVVVPGVYSSAPRCEKPIDKAQLMRCLTQII